MKSKINWINFLLIVIAISAFTAGIYLERLPSNLFTIATTEEHVDLFKNENALPRVMSKKVELKVYSNRNDLLKAVYSNEVDAYIVDAFHYVQNYPSIGSSRAILGIPSNKLLVSESDNVIQRPRIASYDEIITNVLIENKEHTLVRLDSYESILNAFNTDFVNMAVISEAAVNSESLLVVNTLKSMGYTEDVLVLTSTWIDEDLDQVDETIDSIKSLFKSTISLPDESSIMSVMGYLFKTERIQTRYYYKDLVFTQPEKP